MVNDEGPKLGNYRLLKLLGRGGFADVFLGEHIYLKTSAAIKILRTQLSDDALDEFLREAQIIARLSHPHIIGVHDFGIEKSLPYFVMGYASHGTLRERHPEGSVLAAQTVVSYVNQVAQALQYAHEHKIVHRDVKPENMLLDDDEKLMLSDFGIAITSQSMISNASSSPAPQESPSPQAAKVVGTMTYMAPEQCADTPVYASDQYALAVVAYEWLGGVPPFIGAPMDIVRQHIYQQPPPLREKMPTISPAIEQVVMRALAKDPQARFPRVIDFANALSYACSSYSRSTRHLSSGLLSSSDLQVLATDPLYSSSTVAIDRKALPTELPLKRLTLPSLPTAPKTTPTLRTAQQEISAFLQTLFDGRSISRRTALTGLGALAFAGGMGCIAMNALQGLSQDKSQAMVPTARAVPKKPAPTPNSTQPPVTPTPTPNPFVMGNTRPALTSWGAGLLDMFVRGTNNSLWHRTYDGAWHDWESVAAGLIADPAVVSWGSGRFDVFARGADNSLQHIAFDGSWHPWESLGGTLTSDAAVSSWGPNRLDAFARSTDNALWHTWYDGSWHPWESLGGVITSSPTAVSWGPNTIDVFARGADNGLWVRHFDGSWHDWTPLGNAINSDPTVASWGPGHLDVFALGMDNTLYHIGFDGSWHPWETLGGALISAPSAISWGSGSVDVFARGTNSILQHIAFAGVWQPWAPLP